MESIAIELFADAASAVSNSELGVVLLRCIFGWGLGFVCYKLFCKKNQFFSFPNSDVPSALARSKLVANSSKSDDRSTMLACIKDDAFASVDVPHTNGAVV